MQMAHYKFIIIIIIIIIIIMLCIVGRVWHRHTTTTI